VGIAVWIAFITAVGYAVPLPGIHASPSLLLAVAALFLLTELTVGRSQASPQVDSGLSALAFSA